MDVKGSAQDRGEDVPRAIVVADMLFASRVRAAASVAGVQVRVLGRPAGLVDLLRKTGCELVLVDLELMGGRGPDAVLAVRAEPDLARVHVVAFTSHTNTTAIEAGRAAGADRVLARSAFVRQLPDLLAATT